MSEKCILLLLASNSDDSRDPRADEEIRRIEETIQSATHRDSFEPRFSRSALEFSDIATLLNRLKPHILHLGGHGRTTEGLVLKDDNSKLTVRCDQLVNLILSSVESARL